MANKGLPKKYAKMGFAKGWKAYKRSRSGSTTNKRKMAKTKTRYRYRTTTPKRRSRRSAGKNLQNLLIGGAVAGIAAPMVPLGVIGRLGVGLLFGKKAGLLGAAALGIGIIGAAELGKQVAGGGFNLGGLGIGGAGGGTWQ